MKRIAIVAAWLGLLVAGSFMPQRAKFAIGTTRHRHFVDLVPYPPLSRVFGDVVVIDQHRLVHFFAFGLTAVLVTLLLRATWARIVASMGLFVMAVLIEAGEHYVFHNPFEWLDVRDDAAGIVTALAIVQIFRTLRRQPAGENETGNPAASGK